MTDALDKNRDNDVSQIDELHRHLGYESATSANTARGLERLRPVILSLLPLLASIDDRMRVLASHGVASEIVTTLVLLGPILLLLRRWRLPFGAIDVTFDPARVRWGDQILSNFSPADELAVSGLDIRYRRPGIGAPLAADATPPVQEAAPVAKPAPAPVVAAAPPAAAGAR